MASCTRFLRVMQGPYGAGRHASRQLACVKEDLCGRPAPHWRLAVALLQRRGRTLCLMLIIAGHYLVDASQRDAYVEAFRDLVTRARAAPGCLDVAITADTVDAGRVNMYERWEDEDTLAAFRAVADPPDVGVEMTDMQVSKFTVDRETDPFD